MAGALLCLLAAAGVTISLVTRSIQSTGPGSRTIVYRLGNDGVVYRVVNGSVLALENWCVGGVPGNYAAYATNSGDPLTSGTLGSEVNLGTTRDWTLTNNTVGAPLVAVLAVQVRDATSHAVLASATITMTADRQS